MCSCRLVCEARQGDAETRTHSFTLQLPLRSLSCLPTLHQQGLFGTHGLLPAQTFVRHKLRELRSQSSSAPTPWHQLRQLPSVRSRHLSCLLSSGLTPLLCAIAGAWICRRFGRAYRHPHGRGGPCRCCPRPGLSPLPVGRPWWGTLAAAPLMSIIALGSFPCSRLRIKIVFFALWALYISIYSVGQTFLSFQWDMSVSLHFVLLGIPPSNRPSSSPPPFPPPASAAYC